MNVRAWLARMRGLFTSAADEARFNEETAAHLAELAADYIRQGLAPDAACAAARREFGNLTAIAEVHREQRRNPFFDSLWQDLRYAARQFAAKPGFAAAAIATLALGIGANAAIFRVLDAVVLQTLPVKHPEQLVVAAAQQRGSGGPSFPNISYPLFREMAARQTVLNGFFATIDVEPDENRLDEALHARLVSGTYFEVLGTAAAIGRTILPEDDRDGAPPVAVISYAHWQRTLGGDPGVLGRAVRVNGVTLMIVGVAPRGFFGERVGTVPDVWLPLSATDLVWPKQSAFKVTGRGGSFLTPMGRLRPDVPPTRAEAELSALYSQLQDYSPHDTRATSFTMKLRSGSHGIGPLEAQYSAPLRLLMAIAALVLLLACCNLANLLLSHGCARTHEMNVRLALGARRGRLLRQLLTESSLLAALGAALGFVLAAWGSAVLVQLADPGNGLRLDLAPDERLLIFLAAISVTAVVLFGLAPALLATRAGMRPTLEAGRRASGGRRMTRMSRAFMTAQIAVSVILVSGAALLTYSFRKLETQNFGYRQEGLLLVRFKVDHALLALRDPSQVMLIWRRLNSIPGVRTAAIGGPGPLSALQTPARIAAVDGPAQPIDGLQAVVSPAYFETMKIPIMAGRALGDEDRAGSPPTAVLSETAAKRIFGADNPVGREVTHGDRTLRVVGVAHDVRANNPREEFLPIVYIPIAQQPRTLMLTAAVRTAGDPAAFAPAVREAMREQAPAVKIESAVPLAERLEGMMHQERMLALLSGAFGLLALLLASAGLYGVIAYAVERRTQELGIRLALGAGRAEVTAMMLAETGRLLAIGLLLGLGGTIILARGFQSLLFGITAHDPVALTGAAVLLSAVGLGAAYLPARRAGRLDPAAALRME